MPPEISAERLSRRIDWLINLYSGTEKDIYSESKLEILEVNKLGTAHYLVKTKGDGLMVLGQGYENGWVALPWPLNKKLDHVKVNSWANGWHVSAGDSAIVLVYWPQYLEYLGFVILLISLIKILFLKKNVRTN